MAVPVSTTVTELPESRVRVQAEVPAAEVEKRVALAARQLGRNLRVPGFRAGKVPPPVIIQRVGRDAVLDEAVRDSIGTWYSAAIDAARIVPVGEPALDLDELPGEGEPLRFSIEIGVRPSAELGQYQGLEVGRREGEIEQEAVTAELDALRERTAKLETVERPAGRGDFVVIDFLGTLEGEPFPGGERRDQMVELGSGRLVQGFEDQLEGASAGETRTVTITFPVVSDSGDESDARGKGGAELAGREARFEVNVKEVKAKELPELGDDLAVEAGFDTLAELEGDIRERLAEAQSADIDAEFREAALDSAVAQATVEVPAALVESRARELWDQMAHTLAHQGIPRETYLQITGKTEDELVEEGKEGAERDLRREAVLAAVVEAEGIEPTEEELLEALERAAVTERSTPKKLLERLRSSGRVDGLRHELTQRKAVDLIADSAKPISVAQAQARDKLWTPGAERPQEGAVGGLWTPGG
ncbi:MAG TPA: trigger factor [Solirubrobacteraceae bacterium]|nr:trigger factor [Solirubrobacteraceae bacterium]